jgi:diguanylate cyclase (GGDEF)-like protein
LIRRDILLIEDNDDAREALATLLEHHGYTVRHAENGVVALEEAMRQAPDLVITDLEMPVLSGFEVLEHLRNTPALADTPVIVVSAHHDVAERVAGLDRGADDFLAKPVELDELLARVRRQLLRSDRQREIVRTSMVDSLTGVLNRTGLTNFYTRELERSRTADLAVGVMLIDLNDFKQVNDTWGHAAGDTALCAVACGLQDALRAHDRIGRMGGDEFAIVLPDTRRDGCGDLIQRVRRISPIMLELSGGEGPRIGLSLGMVCAEPGEPFATVLARADAAMYEDKHRQKRASDSLS